MDIRDPDLRRVFEIEKPDFVNHHAAQMDVRRSLVEPQFDADVNILGSLALINLAHEFDVKRFVYISSGGAAYGEPIYLPCDEHHPINPICQYGASKHTVEHYLYLYWKIYGLEYVVLRYPNVYGPRQNPQGEAGVVAIFTGQMAAGEQIVINGDGEQVRDFVYVKDCADANLSALQSSSPVGIYNIGSGEGTSINEVYSHLKRITGYQKDAIHAPAKLGETRKIYLDATKAIRNMGWRQRWGLEDGLEETVRYFYETEQEVLKQRALQQKSRMAQRSYTHKGLQASREIWSAHSTEADQATLGDGVVDPLDAFLTYCSTLRSKSLDQETMGTILRLAMNVVQAHSGGILMLSKAGEIRDGLISYDGNLRNMPANRFRDTLERGLAGWVSRHKEAALVQDTRRDQRWLKQAWELESDASRSVLSLPLLSESAVVGVITLVHKRANQYSLDDLALMATLVSMISVHDGWWNEGSEVDKLPIAM
jgi:UDP-glucose 4-epimerase